MRIAITGATGFIGKWLLKTIPDDFDCILLGRKTYKDYLTIGKRKFEYVKTDFSFEDLTSKLKGLDGVIHLAATRVGKDEFSSYIPNITVSENIFKSCIENDIKNIVCISSISVYSNSNVIPWDENQRVSPVSFYGISKVAMENLADYYNRKKSMKIKSLRVAQVVGYGERPGYMLMTFINNAFEGKTLNVFGEGAGKREYIYIKDVVDAILCAIKKSELDGVFNIGTGVNVSHNELAQTINSVFNNEVNIKYIKDIVEDKSIFLMDNSLAEEKLNWKAKWSLKEGIEDIKRIMNSSVGDEIDEI